MCSNGYSAGNFNSNSLIKIASDESIDCLID